MAIEPVLESGIQRGCNFVPANPGTIRRGRGCQKRKTTISEHNNCSPVARGSPDDAIGHLSSKAGTTVTGNNTPSRSHP